MFGLSRAEQEEYARRKSAFRAGRNHNPDQLDHWWANGELTLPLLRALIAGAWDAPDQPVHALGEQRWIELWKTARFVSTAGTPPPTARIPIYRGAALQTKGRGMSWTNSIEKARWFARRFAWYLGPAGVYVASVAPSAVLAFLDGPGGRNEQEVVVNPRTLRGQALPRLIEVAASGNA